MAKVSIIVPTYNVEKYLVECMESIVNQTLKDIEIICVDDGSTDNSGKILDEYAQKDNRIKVIHKENGGYGKAMNIGLDNATGEYIGIVEPDDYIALDMYETLYNIAKEKDLDFIKSDFNRFVGEGENLEKFYNKLDESNRYYNIVINPQNDVTPFRFIMNTWSGIYKKSFLDQHNIKHNETPGASFQDNGFWFQTFMYATRIYFLNKPFYMNRRDNPNSSIMNKSKVFCICEEYDFIENILKHQPNLNDDIWQMFYAKKFANYMWTFNRVAEIYKYDFLKRFAKDFQNIDKKYLKNNLFGKNNYKELKKIISSSEEYYKKLINNRRNEYRLEVEDWFKKTTKKRLNLKNPKTFNEKIQWLKLYDSTPLKIQLADKYLVRDWVKEKIGEEYLIPLLGVYDNFDEIDFDKLPNQFVIKCNHGSGYNIIVKDKSTLDKNKAKEKITKWMNENYAFKNGLELHYSNIPRKIIIEDYIDHNLSNIEIQSWCFNDEISFISYENCKDTDKPCRIILTPNWEEECFMITPKKYSKFPKLPEKPKYFEELKNIVSTLCKGFIHVRIDFIAMNNRLYFREMTFTPGSGLSKFKPNKIKYTLGEKIKLPKLAYDIHTGEYYELKFSWKDNLHKIFSIRKNLQRTHKIITILGLQFRIKRKQKK